MQDDKNLSPAELERKLKEKKWEAVQIKGLSAWLNSYLSKAGLPTVTTVPDDLCDGVKLLQFLELASEKPGLFGNYRKDTTQRIHKIENCSIAIRYIKEDLGVRLVGIGPEDIVDGNLMLVLGFLWSSFRKLSLGSLGGDGKGKKGKPEDDLLKWIAGLVSDYGIKVTSFKDSFNDGLAWAALIDRFDPEFLDFDSLDKSNPEATLNLVFDVAEKKLGIPKLFDASEMLSGNPDERSVVLYSSLFYHAWTSNQDRIKLANEKRGLGTRMTDLKAKLQAEEEERQRLLAEKEKLLKDQEKHKGAVDEEDRKLRELRAAIKALEDEKERIKAMLAEELASRKQKLQEDVKKMGSLDKDLLSKLEQERERGEQLGKENADLLTENYALLEKLRRALGLNKGEGLGFDLFDASKGGLLNSVSGMNNLSALLREHVNTLHVQYKEMQDKEEDPTEKHNILEERRGVVNQVKEHVTKVLSKPNGEAKEYLADKFKPSSETLGRVLGIKDVVNELHEVTDKRGYLLAQVEGKRWKKRWFMLRGFVLYYYNKREEQDDIAGSEGELDLATCSIEPQEFEGKPTYAIKLTVTEDAESSREELVIGAKTKEERDDWLCLLQGKILYIRYLAWAKKTQTRPDTRLIALFASRNISTVNLDELPLAKAVLELLADLFTNHQELERISLSRTEIDDDTLGPVSEFLSSMPGLVSVNLSHNKITSRSLPALAKVLSQHSRLKILDLSHNEIDDAGVQQLVAVLAANPDLEQVNLAHNRISGVSDSFVQAVGGLRSLAKLELQKNGLSDVGAAEVSKILADHPSIVSVKLQNNKIGDKGATAILEALKSNTSVTNLNLAHNAIGTQGLKHLKSLFEANSVLRKVELSGNNNLIGGKDLRGLCELPDVEVPNFAFYRAQV